MPADLTEDFINYVDSSISSDGGGHSPNYYLDLLQKKFNFYLSFQHSYITAKLINSTSKSLPTILAGSLPEVISSLSNETVQDIVNDVSTLSAVKDGV
ncbi:hypothetical protein FACS1894218_2350 [Bacilli bacterium]|nr:hypothetical protein FACS1894218_2350 [Bacilli bacterium]